tara:strand:+ start:1376 stop:2074 length:699 start_codon:yes stop_codon:yes gene_type:complete
MGVGFNIPHSELKNFSDVFAAFSCGIPEFAVPLEGPVGPSNTDEFARNHRFTLERLMPLRSPMAGAPNTTILLNIEKCTRPSVEFDEIKIHSGQDEIYRPGKHRWNPIEFTFYERVGGKTSPGFVVNEPGPNLAAQAIWNWWGGELGGPIGEASTLLDWKKSRQSAPNQYQFDAQINMINGLGQPVWTYTLHECWPLKVSSTDLNYADTELSRTTITLRFNRAVEQFARGDL